MTEIKKQIGTNYTRALFDLTTIDKAKRTVDVVFATEAEVMRIGWDGMYKEVLSCDSSNVRMDRINSGAPLLDTHDKYSITSQLGVVENARMENQQGKATVRFSKRDDVEKVWNDVQDGIIRGISVGYNVYQYDIQERVESTIPVYRATDWEPTEISLVPVPADFKSGVRSTENLHEVKIISKNQNQNTMSEVKTEAPASIETRTAPVVILPPANTDAPVNVEEVRAETVKLTAKRSSEILHAVRSANLDIAFAETLINDSTINIDQARAAIITKLSESNSQVQTRQFNMGAASVTKDETDKRRKGMETAIMIRSNVSGITPEERKEAAPFIGLDLMDMARKSVEVMGVSTEGKRKREIAQIALNVGERQLSTSDFPNILGNTINRTLRAAYEICQRTYPPFTRKKTAKDFRDMTSVQLGDLSTLDEIKEGGEYKYASLGEGAEKYRVVKYGKIINITWETLINDDLNAFDRIPQIFANAACLKQCDIVYGILLNNAALSDSVALFHATHGNLAGTGSAISVASLAAARAAIRVQKSLGGSFMNLTPKFLIVGPAKEMEAFQFTSTLYTPTKGADINPTYNTQLTVIVDPRITGNAWYLSADPNAIDTIEYAFLDGEELFTEHRLGFDVDGMQTKVRMVFGAKAIDYRGLYMNAGN